MNALMTSSKPGVVEDYDGLESCIRDLRGAAEAMQNMVQKIVDDLDAGEFEPEIPGRALQFLANQIVGLSRKAEGAFDGLGPEDDEGEAQ